MQRPGKDFLTESHNSGRVDSGTWLGVGSGKQPLVSMKEFMGQVVAHMGLNLMMVFSFPDPTALYLAWTDLRFSMLGYLKITW